MNNRRHADNFTPDQKSPIPLNRFDDFVGAEPTITNELKNRPERRIVARALYNFQVIIKKIKNNFKVLMLNCFSGTICPRIEFPQR